MRQALAALSDARLHLPEFSTDAIQVELFRWDLGSKVFRRSDVFAFARRGVAERVNVAPVVG